jgi:hypothetical protein
MPTIACDQTANLGACSATVGPANDRTAMLLDTGGEAAQCVGYTNFEDAFRTLGTLFCGP